MIKNLTLIIVFVFCSNCFAQQFSYRPLNPAFGGSNFNYSWMLSSAQAQNGFTADNTAEEKSELEQLGDDLNQQILRRIQRQLLNQQIDAIGGFTEPGSYTFGDLNIEVFETTEGLTINILDTTTGEQTQVIVPN